MLFVSIAPDVREITWPFFISNSVGIPLILKRDETAGALSAFS